MTSDTITNESRGHAPRASFESRIRERYETLPSSERKIADLILEFPGEVAAYSATELAELAGSSKAAVTRLIRRLGFDSFEEARRAARDAQNWGSPLYLLPRKPDHTGVGGRIQRHVEQDIQNISATFDALDTAAINEIVTAILKARRVFVYGYRNSHYLAGYFSFQLIQGRPDVHLLPAVGATLAEYVADMTGKDLVVVIGFRRRVPEVKRLLQSASAAGSRILYITDSSAGSQSNANWTIHCSVRGQDLFDRYAGAISLLHFLSVSLMTHSGDTGRSRLKTIENLHEDLHEFG